MNTPEGSATARRGGILELNAAILAAASVVGGKEREGPLGGYFDFVNPGDRFGQDTWESAESEMQRMALAGVLGKAHRSEQDVDLLLAGDLLNQCAGSAYGLLSYSIPYLGLYGACSTSAEGLLLAAALVSAGFAALLIGSDDADTDRRVQDFCAAYQSSLTEDIKKRLPEQPPTITTPLPQRPKRGIQRIR